MRIDLHTHSSVSDGTESPAELVRAAAVAGLDVIALTDHDTFDGFREAAAESVSAGVRVVPGIEISTHLDGVSVHLLGYGDLAGAAGLETELAAVRRGRGGRVPAMLRILDELGMPVDEDTLELTRAGSPSIGRPHVADAMVALGYVRDRTEAFDKYLSDDGPAFVPRYAPPLARAIDLVHAAGGVAVIAHPWGRGSRQALSERRLASLVSQHGLDGVEVDHHDHDPASRRELRRLADRLGLLTTGSSDYHGTGKTGHPLGLNTTRPEVLAEIERRVGR